MNAALGDVYAGGLGNPELDVTQSGGGPSAFVASHDSGNAGGATLSKFSVEVTKPAHGGHRPREGRIPAIVGPIAMPTAKSKSNKTTFRSRIGSSARVRVLIIAGRDTLRVYQKLQSVLKFFGYLSRIGFYALGRGTGVKAGVACGLGGTEPAGRGTGVGRGLGVGG